MDDQRVRVDEATMGTWAEIALKIRAASHIVHTVSIPKNGSAFATTDDLYPTESSSQWAREPLRSAVDHLSTWANHAVPLEQHDGQVVVHYGFRWTFTLIRAALEGTAQSMQLTQAKSTHECVARLIRAVRDDVHQEIKAWTAFGRDISGLQARAERHAVEAEKWAQWGKPAATLPDMVSLLRSGALYEKVDPSGIEAMWRTCSAAAHGKAWAVRELQVFTDEREWRPGQFHRTGYPDPVKLTRMLDETTDFLNLAVIRYLMRMGADVARELRGGILAAAERTPNTDGGALVSAMRSQFDAELATEP